MTQINITLIELKKLFRQYVLEPFLKMRKKMENITNQFNEQYPSTYQNIQITFIYLFAFINLSYRILKLIFILGGEPVGLDFMRLIFVFILTNPLIQIVVAPERTWLLSYGVFDWILVRKSGFSKLVK